MGGKSVAAAGLQPSAARSDNVWRKIVRDRYLLLMAAPALAFVFLFRYVPMYGVILAFRRFEFTRPFGGEWVGLWYFQMFFSSPSSWTVIRNTFMLNFWDLLLGFPAPILLALLMNEIGSRAFKRATQVISYLPNFISTVVVCSILYIILSPSTGFVNVLLGRIGISPIYFLTRPEWFRPVFILSGIWQSVGWGSIIYMAAITGISDELYEAAVMDGASRWRQTISITLPAIGSTIIVLLILRVGSMLGSNTEKVLLLYNPLTYDVSDVLGTYLYRMGLLNANYSLGTAIGLANSIVSLLLIASANWIARKVSRVGIW